MSNELSNEARLAEARRVIAIEAHAIAELNDRLGPEFVKATDALFACQGRVVVIGMGKSGHIGHKIAATLASTGTPAFFVHAGEASHGDMGMITTEDVVVALSNSGETKELAELLPVIRRLGVPLVTITGNPDSTLARGGNVNLDISVTEEACPHNLAPTASTTATLAMGDALAITLLRMRGFSADDFARTHPGGSLGKRLLLRVADVMRTGAAVPRVGPSTRVRDGLVEMTEKQMGFTAVISDDDQLLGIFTDGDLRRALDKKIDVHNAVMSDVMTAGGLRVGPNQLAIDAVRKLQQEQVTALMVVAEDRVLGALNVHDLFRAGVM